jgi:hypothetical protein
MRQADIKILLIKMCRFDFSEWTQYLKLNANFLEIYFTQWAQ